MSSKDAASTDEVPTGTAEEAKPEAKPDEKASISKPPSSQTSLQEDDDEEEDDEDEMDVSGDDAQQLSASQLKKRCRKRCGKCEACRRQDCGVCHECIRKKKFGGTGASKQACIHRRCLVLKELKQDRKRSRAAGLPVSNTEWDELLLAPAPKKKRRRSGNTSSASQPDGVPSSSSVVGCLEKDPMVTKLEEAFPLPPPSMLAMNHVNPTPKKKETPSAATAHLQDYKYGQKCPLPAKDICAGCRCEKPPSGGDEEPIILLCDGPGCDTEWHLECCLPPIAEVPNGSYFCIDCDPNGSSTLIDQYFDRMEERRAKAMEEKDGKDPSAFLHMLWGEDLEDNQENWNPDEYIPAKDGRVPQSELSRLLDVQQHLVGDDNGKWAPNKPCTFDELAGLFVGKPVRLYCPLDDNYHSGRIVDYRRVPPNLHHIHPSKKSAKSSKAAAFLPNDDFFASQVEFLVRFNPGSGDEYRKKLIYKWLRLEEHSLAVGTHLIWGRFHHPGATSSGDPPASPKKGPGVAAQSGPQASWQQACVFLRTSRELMPVLHLLQEKLGEVNYHPASLMGSKSSKKKDSSGSYAIPKTPKKTPAFCLAKRFGVTQPMAQSIENPALSGESYKMLHVTDQIRDLYSRKPSNSHIEQLKHSLACVEHDEQQAAQRWWQMRRRKLGYSAPNAMRMSDEHAVGPVLYKSVPEEKPTVHEKELCPLVRPPGLDRGHLMERLVRCGMLDEATKDTAAGLECWLVPE
ncbi:Histone-lysine N-methyltransferase [Seminavis robusta]|uniref:Histone-lysine N-methyltransferase n=1 Tax=Seminavis robusta TaxID=568900 RepID=A0A9N8DML3_9STRA|nr:Histone-lysine N-methyltransferase [Seminavis robusta]|eukprot:Sro210_g087560.1 Histone-lysine N-methyltransferase (742) ;mRNA; f:20180-22525